MAVDGIVAALRGVGGPQLYRRNAFRVTGLPTDADRKTVRHRQRRVLAALEAGADVDLGHDLPVGTEAVRAAFDEILENPHRRLVDELFWLWGTGSACTCGASVHDLHDKAVRAHSAALDLEAKGDRLTGKDLDTAERTWTQAARLWGDVLRRNGFWNHIRARVAALDERQLDESVVADLREQLPITLLQPLMDLAAVPSERQLRLVGRARTWPGLPDGVADNLLEDVATSQYDDVATAIKEATEELRAGNVNWAVTVVHEQVVPGLDRLEALVPHRRHRRTARVRDRAALVLNNCATVLIERDGPGAEADAGKWLRTAHNLATDPMSHQTIKANQATLDEMVATFAIIEERVDQLLAAGRPDLARTMLRGIKRQLGGATGTAEIDRMLDRVTRGRAPSRPGSGVVAQRFKSPTVRRRVPRVRHHSWWRRHRRKVGAFLAVATVAAVVYLLWPRGDEGTLFAPNLGDNEVLGTCIDTEEGWTRDEGKDEVPIVPCDEPHWAEVLGYAPLGEVPSPSPEQDQIAALAEFECGWLLAEQDLPTGEFMTSNVHPDVASWNAGDNDFDNYATCLLHRVDGEPLGRLVRADPETKVDDVVVPMNVFGGPVWDNAPIGTCLQEQATEDSPLRDLPVVRCDQPHWAEIRGYPHLYDPGSTWPGDGRVWAAALAACEELPLPAGFALDVRWPAQDFWDDPEQPIYGACLARRADHQPFTGGVR
jgi:hypothetical protein